MAFDPCVEPLLDASWNGIPFFVDNDTGMYGRRIVTHEYPMRDQAFQEDMGEKNSDFKVKGYLFGPEALAVKASLVSAARAGGPATLVLPAEGAIPVRLILLNVQRSKDKIGWFDLDFSFKRDDQVQGGPFAAPIYEGLLSSALAAFAAPAATFFDALVNTANVLPFVVDNAVARIQAFASTAASAIQPYDMPASARATLNQTLVRLNEDTDDVVLSGSGIVATITDMLTLVASTLAPADAVAALLPLTTFSAGETPPASASPVTTAAGASAASASVSDIADANNGLGFGTAVRSLALIAYSQAVAAYSYPTRALAIQARADLAESFDSEIAKIGNTGIDAALALEDARDLIVVSLSREITTLKPIVIVDSSETLGVLYWAHRLYGVTSGEEDIEANATALVNLNAIADPSFMPTSFEATSP